MPRKKPLSTRRPARRIFLASYIASRNVNAVPMSFIASRSRKKKGRWAFGDEQELFSRPRKTRDQGNYRACERTMKNTRLLSKINTISRARDVVTSTRCSMSNESSITVNYRWSTESEMFLPALTHRLLGSGCNDGFALWPRGALITVRDISYRGHESLLSMK